MNEEQARQWLKKAVGNPEADFRSGQWEAIDAIVNKRQRLLVVEKTGWGKSIVYFLSARLLRQKCPDALTIVVSPLISLMRDQIKQAQRIEVNAVTINASNTDDWQQHFEVVSYFVCRIWIYRYSIGLHFKCCSKLTVTQPHSSWIKTSTRVIW